MTTVWSIFGRMITVLKTEDGDYLFDIEDESGGGGFDMLLDPDSMKAIAEVYEGEME